MDESVPESPRWAELALEREAERKQRLCDRQYPIRQLSHHTRRLRYKLQRQPRRLRGQAGTGAKRVSVFAFGSYRVTGKSMAG